MLWVDWDDSVSDNRNHQLAAMALAKLMDWDGLWVKGVTNNGTIVWVNASDCHSCDEFHIAPEGSQISKSRFAKLMSGPEKETA